MDGLSQQNRDPEDGGREGGRGSAETVQSHVALSMGTSLAVWPGCTPSQSCSVPGPRRSSDATNLSLGVSGRGHGGLSSHATNTENRSEETKDFGVF